MSEEVENCLCIFNDQFSIVCHFTMMRTPWKNCVNVPVSIII